MMHYSSSWSLKRPIKKRKRKRKAQSIENMSKIDNCINNECRQMLVFNFLTAHLRTLPFHWSLTNLSFWSQLLSLPERNPAYKVGRKPSNLHSSYKYSLFNTPWHTWGNFFWKNAKYFEKNSLKITLFRTLCSLHTHTHTHTCSLDRYAA